EAIVASGPSGRIGNLEVCKRCTRSGWRHGLGALINYLTVLERPACSDVHAAGCTLMLDDRMYGVGRIEGILGFHDCSVALNCAAEVHVRYAECCGSRCRCRISRHVGHVVRYVFNCIITAARDQGGNSGDSYRAAKYVHSLQLLTCWGD